MLALRSLARSAPRTAARLSASSVRPSSLLLPRAALGQPAWTAPAIAPRLAAAFHLSARRAQDGGSGVSDELVAKLVSEIASEEHINEDENLSTNINDYLENSPFEIQDEPGNQEVVLTRTFGDEKIRLTFSTADLHGSTSAEDLEDSAMYDDDAADAANLETQSGGATSKGAVSQGRTPDGNARVAAPSTNEELVDDFEEEDGQQQTFPARTSIRIERPGRGALSMVATAQDGDFLIDEVFYFPSAELADASTAEHEWSRRSLYTGPPFNNLDEDLQILLEKYLEERGINTRLALFIPDYIDHKEQKEYIRWLNKVKAFVE